MEALVARRLQQAPAPCSLRQQSLSGAPIEKLPALGSFLHLLIYFSRSRSQGMDLTALRLSQVRVASGGQ